MEFPWQYTGVGCHFLLWCIFPTQGSNPHLLHWQAYSLSLSHQGSPRPIFCCLVTNLCPTLCNPMDCVDCQAPLSMGFSRQNTGVGCHFLLQGIFLTQGSNPHLLHWQADSLPLCHVGGASLFHRYLHILKTGTE